MSERRRIGVLTGGGDAPGLNAVIRAIVKAAVAGRGWTAVGIEEGFEGLLTRRDRPLGLDDVRGLLPRGGSILGCTNRGHFAVRRDGVGWIKDEAAFAAAADRVRALDLDALIAIGGDGSLRVARELGEFGVPIVGVPKTIDNDVAGTEQTFGHDSAIAFATDAIDRLHTTAESHGRVMVVEVMGRHTGWIALGSGLAGGADVILIPEIPFDLARATARVRARDAAGRRFSIVVAAQGAAPAGGQPIYEAPGGPDRDPRLGGIGPLVARELAERTGKECRAVVLGHLQRGGSPTAFDRVLATWFGAAAVQAVEERAFSRMVAWRGGAVTTVPLDDALARTRTIPEGHGAIALARSIGISFAGEAD